MNVRIQTNGMFLLLYFRCFLALHIGRMLNVEWLLTHGFRYYYCSRGSGEGFR